MASRASSRATVRVSDGPATTVVAEAPAEAVRPLRRALDWRQKFDAAAPYVFSKDMLYDARQRKQGERVPAGTSRHKLLGLWRSGLIGLRDDAAKTIRVVS